MRSSKEQVCLEHSEIPRSLIVSSLRSIQEPHATSVTWEIRCRSPLAVGSSSALYLAKWGLTGANQFKPSTIDQRTVFCTPLEMACYGLCWDRQSPQLHPPTKSGLSQGLTWAPKVITKCMFCSFFIIKWFPRAHFVPGMTLILYINSFNLYLHPVE